MVLERSLFSPELMDPTIDDRPPPDSGLWYRERPAAPDLGGVVEALWTLEGRIAPGRQRAHRVLPDACADVLFALEAGGEIGGGGRVVGAMSRSREVAMRGRVRVLGVRIRPGAAPAVIGPDAGALTDDGVGLADLWGDEAFRLHEALERSTSFESAAARLERALTDRLAVAPDGPDPVVLAAVRSFDRADGPQLLALAGAAGLSLRQLERRFQVAVGLPPSLVRRIRRLGRAAEMLLAAGEGARAAHSGRGRRGSAGRPARGSTVALRAGFYDQAHMVRDFRALAHTTPTAFVRERADVASVQDGEADAG